MNDDTSKKKRKRRARKRDREKRGLTFNAHCIVSPLWIALQKERKGYFGGNRSGEDKHSQQRKTLHCRAVEEELTDSFNPLTLSPLSLFQSPFFPLIVVLQRKGESERDRKQYSDKSEKRKREEKRGKTSGSRSLVPL